MTEVIGHSSHVTIYALDVSTKSWVSLCSQADSEWQPNPHIRVLGAMYKYHGSGELPK